MDARVWKIYIPVKPKAVQSVRGGAHGFYADKNVVKWKNQIRPFIQSACRGKGGPTRLPLRITRLVYMFKYPQKTPKSVARFIEAGGIVPYIGCADITDNLAKGLVDCCAGLVFENDKQIWWMCDSKKIYGAVDGMAIDFMETPDVMLVDGTYGSGRKAGSDELF